MARNDDSRPSFGPLGRLLEWLRGSRLKDPEGAGWRRPEKDVQAARVRVQVGVIRRALGSDVAAAASRGSRRTEDDADAAYLFRADHALIRTDRVEDVAVNLRDRRGDFEEWDGELERVREPVDGLVLVRMPLRTDRAESVLVTLDELDRSLPPDRTGLPVASPDHVVYVTTRAAYCPATEPEVPRRRVPWPPQACFEKELADDEKVRVTVVDTGLWQPAVGSSESPWLETDDVFAGNEDLEQVVPSKIHEYAGHGTFVAGVIACVAPETRIDVEGGLPNGGAVFESDIVDQIQDALEENRPQIISISAGTHTRDNHDLLSFVLLAQNNRFDERDDVLIVAAAGNDSSNEPFFPAAFATKYPWVVSVGSVDPDKNVSDFSNYGKDWVTVYARGRNIVNAYPKGTYKCYEPPNVGKIRQFDGLAQWSGTSFSTPIVAGLIAAEMRDNGLSARAAWDVVRKTAIDHHDTRIGEDIKIVGPLT